ncbi:hypothetical protein Q5752_004085 [Cryptotrichosporon argae]
MVSTRPSPKPAQGRIRYPGAQHYTPGGAGHLPSYASPEDASTSTQPPPATPAAGEGAARTRLAAPPNKLEKSRSADSASGRRKWWKFWEGAPGTERDDLKHPHALGRKRAMTVPNGQNGARTGTVFGAPLDASIKLASTKISTGDARGQLYVYGSIPVVLAKTGLRLKEIALDKEGIFRVPGNAKRIAALQAIFEEGPSYGQDIDWSAEEFKQFGAHDVATIFRRYLLTLPGPLVPARHRHAFLSVIPVDSRDEARPVDECCAEFRALIEALPEANRHTLHYVLDLLSTFAERHEQTKMNEHNLAVMFQPSVFGVGSNDELVNVTSPERMRSTVALAFMIENQARILAGTKVRKAPAEHRHTLPAAPTPAAQNGEDESGTDADVETEETPFSSPLSTPALESSQPSLQAMSPVSPVTTTVTPAMDTLTPAEKPEREGVAIDADAIAQSDSDDDAPAGGYLLIEKPSSARPAAAATPTPASAPKASAPAASIPTPTGTPTPPAGAKATKLSLNIFTSSATGWRRLRRSPPSWPKFVSSSAQSPTDPATFVPSDSDEEQPATGYSTVENPQFAGPVAAAGRLLSRSRTLNRPTRTAAESPVPAGLTGVALAEHRAKKDKARDATLSRRSTLPPRLGAHIARFRRVQEA